MLFAGPMVSSIPPPQVPTDTMEDPMVMYAAVPVFKSAATVWMSVA